MAVSGRRRFDDDKVVKYETTEKDFEVEVSRTLQKWCVTVYQMPDKQILVQDFFPERWKALAPGTGLHPPPESAQEEGGGRRRRRQRRRLLGTGPSPA